MTKPYVTGSEVGRDLLEAVRELKAGKVGRITHVDRTGPSIAEQARSKVGLSQSEFACLLGVSVRTLQDWEQGRREPSGAARTLLRIAEMRPDAVLEAVEH